MRKRRRTRGLVPLLLALALLVFVASPPGMRALTSGADWAGRELVSRIVNPILDTPRGR